MKLWQRFGNWLFADVEGCWTHGDPDLAEEAGRLLGECLNREFARILRDTIELETGSLDLLDGLVIYGPFGVVKDGQPYGLKIDTPSPQP